MTIKSVRIKADRELLQRMKICGMPRDILRVPKFDPRFHTLTIRSELEGYKPRRVKKDRQLQWLEHVLDNPFGVPPYVYVIASNPNDAKARLVAAMILERAVRLHAAGQQPRHRSMPVWHRVYGNYSDRLRDQEKNGNETKERPSLLILSNITTESSNAKLELVRDLLDMYDETPRIVVVAGSDPVTFADRQLRTQISRCLYLSTGHKTEL